MYSTEKVGVGGGGGELMDSHRNKNLVQNLFFGLRSLMSSISVRVLIKAFNPSQL